MTRNSREKLNAHHLAGAIGIAAVLGTIASSWGLFVVVAAALVAASFATGEIRLRQHRNRPPKR